MVCPGYASTCSSNRSSETTLKQHLPRADAGEKWRFTHIDMVDEGKMIANTIAIGEAIAISNGSFKDLYSTAAWVLEGDSILAFAKNLCNFYKITTGSIELGCDGQSALDKAFNFRDLWVSSSITWKFRHIKGHQDVHKSMDSLDHWAMLNVEMDSKPNSI